MFAEAVWKQIEKKQLNVNNVVDADRIARIGAELNEETLGRQLFERPRSVLRHTCRSAISQ